MKPEVLVSLAKTLSAATPPPTRPPMDEQQFTLPDDIRGQLESVLTTYFVGMANMRKADERAHQLADDNAALCARLEEAHRALAESERRLDVERMATIEANRRASRLQGLVEGLGRSITAQVAIDGDQAAAAQNGAHGASQS